jgi:DNA polymerase I-like protein with 3'-5' exonuclease and polymerase domains
MQGAEDELVRGDMVPILFPKLLELSRLDVCSLAFHNAGFDLACVEENVPSAREEVFRALEAGRVHCTETRERLLDVARGTGRDDYSLKALVRDRFDVEVDKSWQVGFEKLEGTPVEEWPSEAVSYAKDDAKWARLLFERQIEDAKALRYNDFEGESARQTASAFALRVVSNRGVVLDERRVEVELRQARTMLADAETEVRAHNLFHPGKTTRNMKAVKELVEASFPGDPPRTSPSAKHPQGQIRTDAEVVAECDHPALRAYSRHQLLTKLVGTYLEPIAERGAGPIHAGFITLVNSGRTSSFKPNLQNLPRVGGVRECVVPREGYVFAFADFDSQELRTLAQVCKFLCGKSVLADRYASDPDFDPHTLFASQVLRISYEEGLARKRAGDPEFGKVRQRCKAANFGFPVGMAPETFVRKCRKDGLDVSLRDAHELRRGWEVQWPEMQTYFSTVKGLIKSGYGTIRQLVSGRLRGGCDFTSAANTFFQGLAADASKNALFQVVKKCRLGEGGLAGSHVVLFLHDEIGIEAPVESANDAALELALTMEEAMEEVCPDVPARCSPMLADRWSKKAKPVFDEDGRLVPWKEAA